MSDVAVLGAGAFGTALAVALGATTSVTLWARDPAHAAEMAAERENARRLPGLRLPDTVEVTADIGAATRADTLLLAVPMQTLAGFLDSHQRRLDGRVLVSCAKGIDLSSGLGASALIARACPRARPALLTGPSFAADIARGLPTALTLACASSDAGARLQHRLSTPALRLYRSTDIAGAELGGALKNVVAIAAGMVIGAGLGDSARAALMTRGYGEMTRIALARGGRAETLAGLSGFGDLVLTCTSEKSRNFRHGCALGAGRAPEAGATVEGAATARAMARLARDSGREVPVIETVAAILDGGLSVAEAADALLARPLKEE
ncbi:glycerol-3-phosphate dehydrogenase [Rhodobacteraceae bacterium WD3A24]|nr:glycerol-3-phosphate dehydrogenase [Rhodobacteraceae bacterium WD3A24]